MAWCYTLSYNPSTQWWNQEGQEVESSLGYIVTDQLETQCELTQRRHKEKRKKERKKEEVLGK